MATDTTPKTLVLQFDLERETKNTYRYAEVSNAPIVGTLYVQKLAFGGVAPASLTVTVEAK